MKKKVLSMVMSLALACSSFGCVTAFADEEPTLVHFSNDYAWESVNVYAWYEDSTQEFGAWPGTNVLEDEKNEGWYTVDIAADYFIFNGAGQTGNITNLGEEMWVYADSTVVTTAPEGWTEGSESNLGDVVSADYVYYVVGEEGLTGVNWGDGFADGNYGIELVKDEYEMYNVASVKDIAAGSYEFKIVQDPANYGWSFNWGAIYDEAEGVQNYVVDVEEDNSVVEFAFMNYEERTEEDYEDTLLYDLEESYDEELDYGDYADGDYEYGDDFEFDESFELDDEFDYSELFTEEDLAEIFGTEFTDEDVAELIAKIGFIVDFFSEFEEMGTHSEYDGDAYLLVSVYSADEADKINKLDQLLELVYSTDLENFTMETLDEILALLGYVEIVTPVEPEVVIPDDVQDAIDETTNGATVNDESPKTGDSPIVPIAVVAGVIALAVVVVLSVKKVRA